MDGEQQGSSSGFPLVSERGRGAGWNELVVGGHVRVKPDPVYEPTDYRFGHDDGAVGYVTITHGDRGGGPFSALFRMNDGSEAVVVGRMPGSDESSLWTGETTVHVADGTGVFEPWVGQDIPLESENPKRWG
jgi:hypothetical protein